MIAMCFFFLFSLSQNKFQYRCKLVSEWEWVSECVRVDVFTYNRTSPVFQPHAELKIEKRREERTKKLYSLCWAIENAVTNSIYSILVGHAESAYLRSKNRYIIWSECVFTRIVCVKAVEIECNVSERVSECVGMWVSGFAPVCVCDNCS